MNKSAAHLTFCCCHRQHAPCTQSAPPLHDHLIAFLVDQQCTEQVKGATKGMRRNLVTQKAAQFTCFTDGHNSWISLMKEKRASL